MQNFVTILLIATMAATLGVLIVGVVSMAKGGEFNARYGNKLMRLRILMQGIAVALFVILMILRGNFNLPTTT
ncbi:MAG: twin transmembrane helix small protein [Alphaproteobacteria bacterium]|nr:twin transmembrane helix small protein [Alphaproteobacteria bacterium]